MGGGSSSARAVNVPSERRMAAKTNDSFLMTSSVGRLVPAKALRYDASYERRPRATNEERMNQPELAHQVEELHPASFAWALGCCRRDRDEAEEVLQNVYVKIFEGKARF